MAVLALAALAVAQEVAVGVMEVVAPSSVMCVNRDISPRSCWKSTLIIPDTGSSINGAAVLEEAGNLQ